MTVMLWSLFLGLLQTVIFYPNRHAEGLRCAYCDSVITPDQCTEEIECDMDQMCQTHAVFSVVYEMRYQMNCFSKMGCDAISGIPHTSGGLCVKCCDTPFCNLHICDTGKTTPQTTPSTISTTMITNAIVTTTATTPVRTTNPSTTTTIPTTKTTISTTPTTTTPATHPTPKQTLPAVYVNHVYYAKYGETLSITCSITGNPVPSVHWNKVGSEAVLSSTPTLIIRHVSEKDQGQYACVAKNVLGTTLAVTSVFITNVPTTTTTHSITTTNPTTHSTTTTKPTTHSTTSTTTTKPTTHSTTTTKPTTHSTTSTTTPIPTTLTTHAPVKLIAPTEQVVWHGDNMSTFCQVIGDGMVHVKWTVLFGTEAGNVQTENGVLEIRNAQPYNEGIYLCSIDGPNVVRTYTHIRVNGSAPEIKKSPSDQTIEERTTLRLLCEFYGHPEPEVRWEVTTQSKRFYVTTMHAEERMHVENRGHTLVIQTAMVTDSGVYSCIGTNYYGRKSVQLHLRVEPKLTTTHLTTIHTEPPRVSLIDKEVVLNGFDLTLTCNFTGIPSPTISWIFNGNNHLPANTVTFSNFLTIRDARLYNSGTYTCHAKNAVGSAIAETKLQVFGMPPMITKAPVSVSLNRGDLLTLSCDASALPRPIISWKFHSHAKGTSAFISNSDGSGALLSAENTKLVIHQAQYTHDGVYTCIARNDYGSAEANATVYIR